MTTVPEGLDDPPRFLFWSLDIVFLGITVFFIIAMFGTYLLGVVVAALVCAVWHKLTHSQGRSFVFAMAYWYLGWSPFQRALPSYLRRLIG